MKYLHFVLLPLLALLPVLMACSARPAAGPTAATLSTQTFPECIYLTPDQASPVNPPMRRETRLDKICLATPKGAGEGKPTAPNREADGKAVFSFSVAREGDYTIFAEVCWQGDDGNSFWVKVDTLPYAKFGNTGPDGRWISIQGPAYHLEPGPHQLIFREREWGAALAGAWVSPVPAYISGGLAFGSTGTLADTNGFREGLFRTRRARLLASPPYSLAAESVLTFNLFYADTGAPGILASPRKFPAAVYGPDGAKLAAGMLPASRELRVCLRHPVSGKYVIKAGSLVYEWNVLAERLRRLSASIQALRDNPAKSAADIFWLPTLDLCLENIRRGYLMPFQTGFYFPDQAYVLAEFTRAEKIIGGLNAGATAVLLTPGIQELAYYSPVDSQLCPYTVYIPKTWSSRKTMPFILFLHGMRGTQWELKRGADARGQELHPLQMPILQPYARGDSWYHGPAETDILYLVDSIAPRLSLDPGSVILSGFSMGGFGTWYLGSKYPGRFRALVPLSGGLPWRMDPKFPWKPATLLPKGWNGKVYILHGLSDDTVPLALALDILPQLTVLGIPYTLATFAGGHDHPPDIFATYNYIYKTVFP